MFSSKNLMLFIKLYFGYKKEKRFVFIKAFSFIKSL